MSLAVDTYLLNIAKDCFMIGSYVFGLNSDVFLHTKIIVLLLETNKCRIGNAF